MSEVLSMSVLSSEPTTIVADFQQFLMYLKVHPVKLTKAKGNLAKKDLRALYEVLPNLGLEVSESSNQDYYPVMKLFIELGQKLELIRKVASGASTVLVIDEEQLALFEKLTMTERYVSLLQCFWLHADWEVLAGGLYASTPTNVYFLFESLSGLPVNKKINIANDRDLKYALHDYGHFLLYFQYFGFWEVELEPDLEKKTRVIAKSIQIQPLLKSLMSILAESFEQRADSNNFGMLDFLFGGFEGEDDEDFEDEDEAISTEDFVAALKPLFENGQLEQVLTAKEKAMKRGEYIFKVAISESCWRTIAMHDSNTLHDLHEWIQRAFDFDDDHLYAFYMDSKPFSRNCYNSPMDATGPFAHKVTLAELYLEEGQQFLYLFDFGDEWHFRVVVEKINEGVEALLPGIRKEKGKAPKQYQDLDW